jgi:hypothetical protein
MTFIDNVRISFPDSGGGGGGGGSAADYYKRNIIDRSFDMRDMRQSEASATARRVFFYLTNADGITPRTDKNGAQPEISIHGAAWSSAAGTIGTLNTVGNGHYFAVLDPAAIATVGNIIKTRFKDADTAECSGESIQVVPYFLGDDSIIGSIRAVGTSTVIPVNDAGLPANLNPVSSMMVFLSGAYKGLAQRITAYNGTIGAKTITVDGFPSNGYAINDRFEIIGD